MLSQQEIQALEICKQLIQKGQVTLSGQEFGVAAQALQILQSIIEREQAPKAPEVSEVQE